MRGRRGGVVVVVVELEEGLEDKNIYSDVCLVAEKRWED